MRALLLLVLFLGLPFLSFSQDRYNCYKKRIKEGRDFLKSKNPKKYEFAIQKFNSARRCDPSKSDQVDSEVAKVFELILDLNRQSDYNVKAMIKANSNAEEKTKLANIATKMFTALYWASESDKIVPAQGMRLLEHAEGTTKDEKALRFIRDQTEKIFKGSTTHQFKEQLRYEGKFSASSADGTWLIARTKKGEFHVWDTRNGQVHKFLEGLGEIVSASFSANGAWLVTNNDKGESRVWDTETEKVPVVLEDQKIDHASFSPNGAWLYTHNNRGESQIWETATGQLHGFLKDRKIDHVVFSANGTLLITFTRDGESQVWDVRNQRMHDFLKNHKEVYYANFSADGAWLITISKEGESLVWETVSGRILNFLKDERGIREASFSANGALLATQSKFHGEWESRVWETANGRVPDFLKDQGDFEITNFSNDGTWLFTRTFDGKSQVWDMAKRQVPNFLKDKIIDYPSFSSDGVWLSANTKEGKSKVWETRTERIYNFLKDQNGVIDRRFSYYGTKLYTGDIRGESQVWETTRGWIPYFVKKQQDIEYASFLADGSWLITKHGDKEFQMQATSGGEVHKFILNDKEGFLRAEFLEDSAMLIEYGEGESRNWKIQNDVMFDFIKDQKDATINFSSDWKLVITGARTGRQLHLPETTLGSEKKYHSLKYQDVNTNLSADGKLKVFESNKKITIIDIASGKTLQTLYLNTKPTETHLLQSRYLYVVAGKAIIKTDILTQPGNLFSYGDEENLDYTYGEIKEWMKVFGRENLLPLSEQTKEWMRR